MKTVTSDQFDELVKNTTHYLQSLVNRVGKLEEEVESLKEQLNKPAAEAKPSTRGKANGS